MNDPMVEENIAMGPIKTVHDNHRFRVRGLVHIDAYVDLVAVE